MERVTLDNVTTERVVIRRKSNTYYLFDKFNELSTVGVLRLSGDNTCCILNITISPEYRRRGYAIEVLSVTLLWLFFTATVSCVNVVTDVDNHIAMHLADKFGFIPRELFTLGKSYRLYTLTGTRWMAFNGKFGDDDT